MNDYLRFLFLLLSATGIPGVGLAEESRSIRAEWKMPPHCEPFGPARIKDLKEELRQTGYRLVIAIHPEQRDSSSGEYAPRDLYLVNADGTGLKQLTKYTGPRGTRAAHVAGREACSPTTTATIWSTSRTLKESEHWGGYVWTPDSKRTAQCEQERHCVYGYQDRRRAADRHGPSGE